MKTWQLFKINLEINDHIGSIRIYTSLSRARRYVLNSVSFFLMHGFCSRFFLSIGLEIQRFQVQFSAGDLESCILRNWSLASLKIYNFPTSQIYNFFKHPFSFSTPMLKYKSRQSFVYCCRSYFPLYFINSKGGEYSDNIWTVTEQPENTCKQSLLTTQ